MSLYFLSCFQNYFPRQKLSLYNLNQGILYNQIESHQNLVSMLQEQYLECILWLYYHLDRESIDRLGSKACLLKCQ